MLDTYIVTIPADTMYHDHGYDLKATHLFCLRKPEATLRKSLLLQNR